MWFACDGDPYWLSEAYSDAIGILDTGIVARNIEISEQLAPLLFYSFGGKATFLDAAGGYGLLTRMMRDKGLNFYWDDKYCQNLVARGFESQRATRRFRAVTAFEVLEHLADPLAWLEQIFKEHNPDALICSTVLYEGVSPPSDWWYYAREGGQHIAFFQSRTLVRLADRLDLVYERVCGFHVFSKRPLLRMKLYAALVKSQKPRMLKFMHRRLVSKTMPDYMELKDAEVSVTTEFEKPFAPKEPDVRVTS